MKGVSRSKAISSALFCRVLALLLATLSAGAALAITPGFQRMVIAPGCYALAPGQSVEVPAYCLDQDMAPPPQGAILPNAPSKFGTALVKIAAGGALSIQAALDQHLLQVEGAGNDAHVRLRNLTSSRLELCIGSPPVVMANGDYASGDLAKLYQRIARILAPAGAAAEGNDEKTKALHAERQQALWQAVNEAADKNAEEDAYKALSQRILFGTAGSTEGGTGSAAASGSAPTRARCSSESNGIEICTSN